MCVNRNISKKINLNNYKQKHLNTSKQFELTSLCILCCMSMKLADPKPNPSIPPSPPIAPSPKGLAPMSGPAGVVELLVVVLA